MYSKYVRDLEKQNRLLKFGIVTCVATTLFGISFNVISKNERVRFSEIDVERVNIIQPDGRPAIVLTNGPRMPDPIISGKIVKSDRGTIPGIIFFNSVGDEAGGLIFDGKLGPDGRPQSGMHISMDRFGGDQQLALRHSENRGYSESGLEFYDRGLYNDYAELYDAWNTEPAGPKKDQLFAKWKEAGGQQTRRLFLGKTRGKSSALILADAAGKPRIMMLVAPDGAPTLSFLDEAGRVLQSFPTQNDASHGESSQLK